MRYLIGLDNGGTVIKAAVFDETGRQIASVDCRVELITPQEGRTERDLNVLWQANAKAIKSVIDAAKVDPYKVVGIAVSGHGKGLYMLDKQGKPLYNGIVSTDNRALKYELDFKADGTADKVFETNYQSVLACQPVCLLRWLKDNRRDIYNNIGAVFSAKDYVRYMLTGEVYAERTDCSGTNLLNLKTGKYDEQLLKLFGIEEVFGALPPLKNSADKCGAVTKQAAILTGLVAGTAVGGGLFDIDACAVGIGVTDERDICVIAGTWSINEYISKIPVTDKSVSMNSYFCVPGYYLVEECSPTSAGNLDWILQQFFADKIAEYNGLNEAFYKALNAEVANVDSGELLFLPFLFASNENANLKGTLIGLSAATTKAQIARAVYEGVVYSHKKHLDKLLSSRNLPRAIRLAGGAANSLVWSQIFADVLNLKIETVIGREHGCFGAAITAGIAAGVYSDYSKAASKAVLPNAEYFPNQARNKQYAAKYARYRKLVELLELLYI